MTRYSVELCLVRCGDVAVSRHVFLSQIVEAR